jgi:alcohol dehydrogenase class IV
LVLAGGCGLDVARALVLRVNHREDLFKYDDLIGGDVYVTNDVPHFITIPTTAVQEVRLDAVRSLQMTKLIKRKFFFLQSFLQKLFLPIRY